MRDQNRQNPHLLGLGRIRLGRIRPGVAARRPRTHRYRSWLRAYVRDQNRQNPTCWGRDEYGAASPPAGLELTAIAAGYGYTCGIRTDRTHTCWGEVGGGSGDGDYLWRASPPAGLELTAIAAGRWHMCGIKTDRTPTCWGDDSWSGGRASPPAGLELTAIAAGYEHTCGIKTDRTPTCWGDDSWSGRASPPAGLELTAIAAGRWHMCGIKTDEPHLLGLGRIRGGVAARRPRTHRYRSWRRVYVRDQTDRTPTCWGRDEYGRASPPAGLELTAITTGSTYNSNDYTNSDHMCGIKTDRTPTCWGDNSFGQTSPPAGLELTAIAASHGRTCGIKTDRTGVCWGNWAWRS